MSQSGIANLAQTGGGGLIQTINGDTGSITGNVVTIWAGNNFLPGVNYSGATVKFINSGTVSLLQMSDGANTFIGLDAGSTSVVGNANCGVGSGALRNISSGVGNTALGEAAGLYVTTGSYNTIIGEGTGNILSTGSYNVILGNSGGNWTANESSNIALGAFTFNGDNNTIRIGIQGSGVRQQNTCFIAGIVGVTASNAQLVTINSSTGQLGVVSGSPVVGTWTDVTTATQTLAVGNGYATDRGGGVTYTLPATATFGDLIKIVGKSGIATITPNANQQIVIGSINGTVGVTGTAVAQIAGSCIALRCITGGSSSVWRAEEYPGGWNLT